MGAHYGCTFLHLAAPADVFSRSSLGRCGKCACIHRGHRKFLPIPVLHSHCCLSVFLLLDACPSTVGRLATCLFPWHRSADSSGEGSGFACRAEDASYTSTDCACQFCESLVCLRSMIFIYLLRAFSMSSIVAACATSLLHTKIDPP